MIPIRLIGPRVLVALEPEATTREESTGMEYQPKGTTESGIILAAPTDQYDVEPHSRGMVVGIGEKTGCVDLDDVMAIVADGTGEVDGLTLLERLYALRSAPFEVAVGDVVLFPPSAGIRITGLGDDLTYVELKEADIWAVIEPATEAA